MNSIDSHHLPLISIVMPTFNQAEYLSAALDSVFQQRYPKYELIIVDDGSTDATAEVLHSYSEKHDFRLISQANQGLPKALNVGFSHAGGQYLTWTSSDNIIAPEMLQVLAEALENDGSVGVVYSDWHFIDEAGQSLGAFQTLNYNRYFLLYSNIVHCSFLYRRECMEKAGLYDPELEYGEDWEYWIRVSRFFKMKRVPLALYSYRLHSRSMTSDIVQGRVKETGYDKFARRIRRDSPIAWFYSRLRWRLNTLITGRDMRKEWMQVIGSIS